MKGTAAVPFEGLVSNHQKKIWDIFENSYIHGGRSSLLSHSQTGDEVGDGLANCVTSRRAGLFLFLPTGELRDISACWIVPLSAPQSTTGPVWDESIGNDLG